MTRRDARPTTGRDGCRTVALVVWIALLGTLAPDR